MTNESSRVLGADEYQFPNEEYITTEHVPPVEPEVHAAEEHEPENISATGRISDLLKRFPIGQHKRAIIIVVAALVALVLFKIMAPSHHEEIVQAKPVTPTVVAQTPDPSAGLQMQNQLDSLKQATAGSQDTVTQLKTQVQDLKDALTQVSTSQAQLSQTIAGLADQVKNLSQQVKTNAQPKPVVVKKPVPFVAPIVYHLKAIIQGRAWIEDSNGDSDTVSVGDIVPQYGAVKSVDFEKGVVLTSSGKLIRYGAEDK